MNKLNRDLYPENGNQSNDKVQIPRRWFFSRILCFVLALGIWIYVVNVTTQDFEKTFNLIDIDIEGWEQLQDSTNMSVVNLEESKVSITVRGLRSDISKLTERDFSAYIDVSKLTHTGKHNLEVSVDLPSTVSLVSKYPETVTISIDENIERVIDVEIAVTEYIMDNIYEMGEPTSDITSVVITGPSDILNRVKAAKAFINLGTVMTSTVIRTEIVLVDKTGNTIDTTYLTMDNTSVTVTVPVTMEKDIELVCSYLPGVDRSAYSSVMITPRTIKVKGDPKILNTLNSIAIYALDGSGGKMHAVDFSGILLPSGVEAIDPPKTVKISAELVPVTTETEEVVVNVTEPETDVSTETPEVQTNESN